MMKKHSIDEKTGIAYTLQGDYYLPDVALSDKKTQASIGIWGMRHKRFLKENRRGVYNTLLMSEKIGVYFGDIEQQANAMFNELVKKFAEEEQITEKLKEKEPMLWTQKMNDIRNRATEIVKEELIYKM